MLSYICAVVTNRTFNCNKRSYGTDSERKQLDNRKHTSKYSNIKNYFYILELRKTKQGLSKIDIFNEYLSVSNVSLKLDAHPVWSKLQHAQYELQVILFFRTFSKVILSSTRCHEETLWIYKVFLKSDYCSQWCSTGPMRTENNLALNLLVNSSGIYSKQGSYQALTKFETFYMLFPNVRAPYCIKLKLIPCDKRLKYLSYYMKP